MGSSFGSRNTGIDPGHFGGAVSVQAERAADVLDDLDLGAAGVGEAHGLDPALAGDVDAFSKDAAAGEEGAMHPPARGVDAVGELPERFPPLGDEVVAAQPCRPHAVRGYVAADFQLVEVRVDRRLRQPVRGGQVGVGRVVQVQRGCGLGELVRERAGFFDLLVERHDRTQVVRRRVLQKRGLQQGQPPAPPRLLRLPDHRGRVADLQDVDLEHGKNLPLDRLREP